MTEKCISSVDNPHVKQVLHLREKRERDKSGLFLIEGYRELLRATESAIVIKELFICPELFLGSNEPALIKKIKDFNGHIITCSEKVFSKISYRDRPDGLLATAVQMRYSLEYLQKKLISVKAPLLVIAEAVEKPGNLGTILRSADGAGAHAVIVSDRCTDIYNPNVVRSSVGTLFTLPVLESTTEELLSWLKKQKITILSAMPQARSLYTEVDMTGPIAIVMGTEQLGLSKRWKEEADIQVRIPMQGMADSLNVAQACTLLLYEAARQRAC